jgi:hypothetical protein
MATKLTTPDDLLRFLARVEADFPGRVYPLSALVAASTKQSHSRSKGATTRIQYGLIIAANLGSERLAAPGATPVPLPLPLAQYSNADLGYV